MKSFSLLFGVALVTSYMALTACGSSGGSSGGTGTPTDPGYNVAGVCQAGTIYVSQYPGCYSQGSCPAGYGWVPQVSQCWVGSASNPYAQNTYGTKMYKGVMNITNSDTYRKILKDWGVCDQGFLWNVFAADCNAWDNQAYVNFQVSNGGNLPAQGTVSIIAVMDGYGYDQRMLAYPGTVSPINNNSGFELRTVGTVYGYNNILSATGNGLLVNNNQPVQSVQLILSRDGVQFGVSNLQLAY